MSTPFHVKKMHDCNIIELLLVESQNFRAKWDLSNQPDLGKLSSKKLNNSPIALDG